MKKNSGVKPIEIDLKVREFDTNIFKTKRKDAKSAMRDLHSFLEDKGLI